MRKLLESERGRPRDRRSGGALVLAGLCCLVLIPMIGLAIDGANVYIMRNQINTALDAAVLAGNRSLNLNQGVIAQTCNAVPPNTCPAGATNVAQQTFMADVAGNMSMATLTFTSNQDPTSHIISVTGTVNASIPLMMMGMLGVTSTNINLTATSQRRVVNIVMVLDHSAPMQNTIGTLTTAASAFVGTFVNGSDNVGLIGFTAAPFSPDPLVPGTVTSLPQVQTDISTLTVPSTYSVTNPSAAIWAAYQQLLGVDQPGALNVIVLFIGTVPNAYTANFAGLLTSTTYCSPLTASPLYGVIWANPYIAGTGGLADYTSASLNDTPESRGARPYCTTDTNGPGAFLSSMPAWAGFNNDYSTNGSGTIGAYRSVNLNAFNKVSVTEASENALDDAANRIRSDATIAPVIFTIAFNSNLVAAPDSVLMARIANDPTSASYNSGQPAGQYIYAPSAQAIQTAFSGISSKVLQLAK
jgi:Flp pilus assembly protein TadG